MKEMELVGTESARGSYDAPSLLDFCFLMGDRRVLGYRMLKLRLIFVWFFFSFVSFGYGAQPPNLIVVMVDDMGYEGVSCFGNPYFKTPEIDRLSREGMRLTDFHSSGTVCSPTRAGLLTGRYQQRAGIEAVIHPVKNHPEHRKGLMLSETTFAEALGDTGYNTALVGKWHQGYPENSADFHPQNHGFDKFVGYHSGNIDFVSHVGDHNLHDWWHGRKETREKGYSTDLINRHALQMIREFARDTKPFYLYVAHEAIHNPVQVPGDGIRRTTKKWDRWDWRKVSTEERIEKYRGMMMPVDDGIGQLRETLIELGIDRQTLILFFSDNGPSYDFPSGSKELRGGKGSVYEGGHKVPAIAWWPGTIPENTESDEPIISIDIMPTLVRLAGASTKSQMDGVDISPVLLKRKALPSRPLFWASLSNKGNRSEAMREGDWKLVVQHPNADAGTFQNAKVELYDLALDPSEESNLITSHPDVATEMHNRLKAWYADTTSTAPEQPGGWLAN
ncbi:MAG: sulfatase-like hydrolase/transferase [Planctomycetota bacterium]